MTRLLIVEDQPKDLRVAADVAESLGFTHVDARASAMAARVYLERALENEGALPDAVILDLDLGYESGFELLRYWHGNPRLKPIRMIVWTIMGDDQREICRLFKVHAFVSKVEDVAVLRDALGGLTQAVS
jgi:CheY-like chemotaxis protein